MKTLFNICPCCGKQHKALTQAIAVENLSNVIICKGCALELHTHGTVEYGDNILLKVVGKRGDFKVVKAYQNKKQDYFERMEHARELAMMDNQPIDNWDVMNNY